MGRKVTSSPRVVVREEFFPLDLCLDFCFESGDSFSKSLIHLVYSFRHYPWSVTLLSTGKRTLFSDQQLRPCYSGQGVTSQGDCVLPSFRLVGIWRFSSFSFTFLNILGSI